MYKAMLFIRGTCLFRAVIKTDVYKFENVILLLVR